MYVRVETVSRVHFNHLSCKGEAACMELNVCTAVVGFDDLLLTSTLNTCM